MSYGFPEPQQRRPKAGCGRFFFFIILAVGAFIFFSNRAAPVRDGGQGNGQKIPGSDDRFPEDERRITMDDLLEGKGNGSKTDGDWNMEEVETSDSRSSRSRTNPRVDPIGNPDNKSTQKGDWSMGEVDTDPQKKSDGFKFSNPNEDQAPPKKTQKGDWEIEEGNGSG